MKQPTTVMSKEEYRARLQAYQLTQSRAAWLFNAQSERTGRRWALQGAPFHVALLLELMAHKHLTPNQIEAIGDKWRKQIQLPKKPSRQPKKN